MDIMDHYELVGEAPLFNTLEEAKVAASNDPDRIWFVRHGDGCDCADMDCECDETWDVALYHGQFVNRMGYFVTTEPCKTEDLDKVFIY